MLTTLVALALIGRAQEFEPTPEPDGPMEISDLHATAYEAGSCPMAAGGEGTSASVRLTWRSINVDNDVYAIRVFEDNNPKRTGVLAAAAISQEINPAGSLFSNPYPEAVPQTSTGLLPAATTAFRRIFRYFVADGEHNRWTAEITYRVQVVRRSDLAVMQEERVTWSATYGTCE